MTRLVVVLLAGIIALTGASRVAGSGYTVGTEMAVVGGVQQRVLIDGKSMTLYYFAGDTPTRSACTGECASLWVPLLSASAPTCEGPLPGKLVLVPTANGAQVAYNGHLLYTYNGDTNAGQMNGWWSDGGKWWAVTVDVNTTAERSR